MRLPTGSVLAVAAAGSLLLMTAAYAQAPSSSPRPRPAPSSPSQSLTNAPPLSDQKLDAAAAAIAHVTYLRQNYQRQLAQADPADRPKIADQANGALAQAVKDQGLSVDEYNSILERAQKDPGIRQKILDRLRPPPGEAAPPGGPPSSGHSPQAK